MNSDEDDDYGFGAPRRHFKKKQPKPVQAPVPAAEKIIKEVETKHNAILRNN